MTRPIEDLYEVYQNCQELFLEERKRVAGMQVAFLMLLSELDEETVELPAIKKFCREMERLIC